MRRPARSQVGCFVFSSDNVFSPAEFATVATLPSALFDERFSLGASWVFSFQPVLPPDYRPRFHLQDESWARRLTQSPELRLTHGECIPVSSVGMLRNTECSAFGLVETFYSRSICPLWSRTQFNSTGHPGPARIVSFCSETFLICFPAVMLIFFIAGLLFICASSTSITWERTPHPVRRPAFSSHLITSVMSRCYGMSVRIGDANWLRKQSMSLFSSRCC
jgi:hypothetical protein